MTKKMKPRKVDVSEEGWCEWVCHPASHQDSDFGKRLVAERDKVMVVAEWSCPDLSYEYDDYAVVRLGHKYAVLQTSGCSCPSPSETWGILFEGNRVEVREYLLKASASDGTQVDFYHDREQSAALELIEQMG